MQLAWRAEPHLAVLVYRWDAHKVGWVIAGATAAVVSVAATAEAASQTNQAVSVQSTVISLFTVFMHARNYYRPKEQRQIMVRRRRELLGVERANHLPRPQRILLMPPVYAISELTAPALIIRPSLYKPIGPRPPLRARTAPVLTG